MFINRNWPRQPAFCRQDGDTDGGSGSSGSGGSGSESDDGGDTNTKTYTQDEMNRIAAKEKKEGRKAAEKSLLESLGVQDADEAKAVLEQFRTQQEEAKSEIQREKEAAQRATQLAETTTREAAHERHTNRVERFLIRANVPVERVDRVARLVDVEVGADDDAIDAAIESVQKDFPELFTGEGGTSSRNGAPSGDPPRTSRPPKARKDDSLASGYERGQRFGQPQQPATDSGKTSA